MDIFWDGSYVETANLDGETNLKIKQSCGLTNGVKSAGDARFLRGVIRCERPNNRLYNFEGVLTLHEGGVEKKARTPAAWPSDQCVWGM
jgi:phospholipid-transporting ATPase